VDGAGRLFAAAGPPLKNEGIFDFLSQFAADVLGHAFAEGKLAEPIAALA
jgi:hypothetical protein